ncbi:Histone-lysine N-methyltransferase NSD2-like protein [Daphnia magna]|uniref:RNA-directed DNA polymerase n=1 Tax=Daphnia magna TaxID=35525 RepID=A0A164M143_9CRUS|nr:Histone-lysine N-methyltransferase NSD2-like protein [Daphnia magna]
MVSFLIDGLAKWQHVAAMTADIPGDVTEFIQRIRTLETLGVASRADTFPPPPGPAGPSVIPATPTTQNFAAALSSFGDKLVNQITAQFNKLSVGSRGAGRGGSSRDASGGAGHERGEVVGHVDTGASVSAIRLGVVRKILNPNRVKSLLKLTGVDDLEKVAVVKSCPFALILGADWIVKSKTNLIVEDDKIVAKSKEPSKQKVKKVRFAGIDDEIVSELCEECPLIVKDELIEALEKDGKKRRNHTHGIEVKVIESAIIPAESLCFVKAQMSKNFFGNVVVRPNMCSHPGLEWIIPSCIVKVTTGRLKIPVLNMKKSVLNLRRKDLLALVEPDFDPSVVVVGQEDQPVNPACPLISDIEQPSWNALKDARIGEKLSTEEKSAVLALLTRRLQCFPSADGSLGYTNIADHVIDTENAHPISCVPYRVSAPERRIIIEKVTEMLRQGIIRPRLNAVTKRDVYPLPRMDDVFDRLAGAKFFSSLDLMSGYWQVLAHFDENIDVCVQTDASLVGLGAVLTQDSGEAPRPVAYISRRLNEAESVDNCVADALSCNPDESCIGTRDPAIGHLVCVFDSRRPVGMSNAELAFQQQLDSQLRPIITSLNSKVPGKFSEQFKIHGKVLYRRNPFQGRKFLLCVQSILRRQIIEFCHDDPSSSHMGIDKTVARVSERYWWPKFRASVRKYVSSCNNCQFHKCIPGFPAGQLQPIPPPDRPFHTIGMDRILLFIYLLSSSVWPNPLAGRTHCNTCIQCEYTVIL